MSTHITPAAELDLDAWLATGERTTHNVNLFARYDLFAEIDALEAQRVAAEEVPEGDEALGGNTNPNADLDAEIEAIEARIYASKKVFRVASVTDAEREEIRKAVLKECSTQIDEEAKLGASEARKSAKRMEISVPADINNLVRIGVNEFTDKLIKRETSLRIIAQSTTVQVGDQWAPVTLEQVRSLYEKLGEQQIGLLANAAMQSRKSPEVTVPKS